LKNDEGTGVFEILKRQKSGYHSLKFFNRLFNLIANIFKNAQANVEYESVKNDGNGLVSDASGQERNDVVSINRIRLRFG
jgi:hypothetical protein